MTARIIAAKRSAVAPRGGAFSRLMPHELAAPVIQSCLDQAGLTPDQVSEIIVSNALGAGGNPARLCALAAGLPERIAGLSVDRQCAGGLDALLLAKALIESGQAQIVVAGGVESYTRRPLRLRTDPDGGDPRAYDQPPFSPFPDRDPDMAEAAESLAQSLNISKSDQDDWSINSHAKALTARPRLSQEIAPIAGLGYDAFTRALTPTHCQRAKTITGSITVANAAVAADAAAFCIVVSDKIASRLGQPSVSVRAGHTIGGPPDCPGRSPIAAIKTSLDATALTPNDLTVAEIMEAYAVQAIACVHGAGINPAITNPGGGALARGHPIGASGAILAVRLRYELMERGGNGLAAIAAAGGIGTALIMSAD